MAGSPEGSWVALHPGVERATPDTTTLEELARWRSPGASPIKLGAQTPIYLW